MVPNKIFCKIIDCRKSCIVIFTTGYKNIHLIHVEFQIPNIYNGNQAHSQSLSDDACVCFCMRLVYWQSGKHFAAGPGHRRRWPDAERRRSGQSSQCESDFRCANGCWGEYHFKINIIIKINLYFPFSQCIDLLSSQWPRFSAAAKLKHTWSIMIRLGLA